MYISFKFKSLALAIASLSVASLAGAAGLDRSGQDVTAFLQEGTYAEAVYTYIDADVTGYDNTALGLGNSTPSDLARYNQGNKIEDIAESYDFFRYGVKADVDDIFSVGILYDEPFGAVAQYSGNNNFVSNNADAAVASLTGTSLTAAQLPSAIDTTIAGAKLASTEAAQAALDAQAALQASNTTLAQQLQDKAQVAKTRALLLQTQAKGLISAAAVAGGINSSLGEVTEVKVHSENLTGLVGMKLGNNFQVYGGPVAQRLKADVALRGPAYLTSAGYTAHLSPNEGYGWLAGAAFMKPEIGLKAALTYRSEIDHEGDIAEVMPSISYLPASYQGAISAAAKKNGVGKIEVSTPESFNFDFQTGLNKTTLATAKIRYVPWGDFSIVPPLYNAASQVTYPNGGLPLVDYSDDQWQVEVGVAKRLTPSVAVSGTLGWDSGAGNPVTSLGPIEGYYSVGAGAKLNLNKNWALSAGGKYLMFGDADGSLPNNKVVSRFEDNDGFVAGVKLSYQDK